MAKNPNLQTISINLPAPLADRVRRLGYNGDISISSIIEIALEACLTREPEKKQADHLKALGATLRRVTH